MIKQPLFQKALPVLKKIEHFGYDAYFVGGSVRDAILGKMISDVDIATSAFPEEIKSIFPKTVDVGIQHGTVMVLNSGESYEITTFRVESTYQDYRRPDKVFFVRSLEEDLKRRDFTINALAMDARGEIYDFHSGIEDLKFGVIRAVGNANERFNEDALRMMRAIRFVAQLNFTLESETFFAIKKNAPLLEKIAIERVREEWHKLLLGSARNDGIKLLVDSTLFQFVPGLCHFDKQLIEWSQLQLTHRTIHSNWASLLYLMQLTDSSASEILTQWKMSNSDKFRIVKLYRILQFRKAQLWDSELLFNFGKELAIEGEQLAFDLKIITEQMPVENLYNNLQIHSIDEIAINGQDIMLLLNRKQGGPYIGQAIKQLKLLILTNQIVNNKDALSQWIIEQYQ